MNTGRFYAPDIIISKASALVDDNEYSFKSRAGYLSIVQKAIESLAIDAKFDEQWADFAFPEDLRLDQPDNCFNVKNIYLFTGQACNVSPGTVKKVYWARNYQPGGVGKGYFKNDRWENQNDPYFHSRANGRNNKFANPPQKGAISPNSLYYYNFQNGQIVFSSSCLSGGTRVMLNFNGLGGEFGEEPTIPALYRTAIEDYVCEFVLRERMAKDPQRWRMVQAIYEDRLNNPYKGSWPEAVMRAKKLNASQRNELNIYAGRGDWGFQR